MRLDCGWQIAGEFVDTCSGSKDHRPQLDAMMRLAKARKVDVIVCWKLDRFGRSLRHLVDALAELQAVGCAFVSLRYNPGPDHAGWTDDVPRHRCNG